MSNTRHHYKNLKHRPVPHRLANHKITIEFGTCEDAHDPYFKLFTTYVPISSVEHGDGVKHLEPQWPALPDKLAEKLDVLHAQLKAAVDIKHKVAALMDALEVAAHTAGHEHAKAGGTIHTAGDSFQQLPEALMLAPLIEQERANFMLAEQSARDIVIAFGFQAADVGEMAFEIQKFRDDDQVRAHADVGQSHLRRLQKAIVTGHKKGHEASSIDLTALSPKVAKPVRILPVIVPPKRMRAWLIAALVAFGLAGAGGAYVVTHPQIVHALKN